MQGNEGNFKSQGDVIDGPLRPAVSNPLRLGLQVASGLAIARKRSYRRVSRQPAASASSVEQNQRVPLLIVILICRYQRLLGWW
jgi:hypothetical protein